MKRILAFVLVCASAYSFSQIQQLLLLPMNEMEFKQRYNQMLSQPGGDEAKLRTFRQFIANRSLTSRQVKQFATTVVSDLVRYDLALTAFGITSDKENFYEVYDAFASFSSVFRLHDAVRSFNQTPAIPQPTTPTPTQPQRPNVSYPSCNNYVGKVGCSLPLSDRDFDFYAATFFAKTNDDARLSDGRELAKRYCLSMAQFMKLAFAFNLDNNRMGFMKENFALLFDSENYNFASAVFSNELLRTDWLTFARNVLNPPAPQLPPAPPVAPCVVSQTEVDEIRNTLTRQSASRTMMAIAKQAIQGKKCFTTKQIIQIVRLFSFDRDQLEIAKFAYDFTTDRENYFTVADALSFSSSKEDLMRFIDSRR